MNSKKGFVRKLRWWIYDSHAFDPKRSRSAINGRKVKRLIAT